MAVTLKEFNAIIQYAQKKMKKELDGNINADAENVIWWMDDWSEITYEDWYKQYKPKREKKQIAEISEDVQRYFEEFWNTFPGTSRFEYNGKKFQGERVLKANKQVCLKLYSEAVANVGGTGNKISKEWEKSAAESVLKALQVQLESIKIESYKSGQNRMQYMKSCEVYLRQKAYEPWMGVEMPEPIETTQYQSTDIDI